MPLLVLDSIAVLECAMSSLSRYLPQCSARALAYVVLVGAACYGVLAAALAINAVRAPVSLASAVPFAVLSWGMWRLKRWARWATVSVLWFSVIVIPIGLLNPFTAMEWEGGAPRWEVLAAWVGLAVAIGLLALHILGKHKKEFTW